MMIGERDHSYLAAQVTTWYSGDQTANIQFSSSPRDNAYAGEEFSPSIQNDAALKAFQRYLPSNSSDGEFDGGKDGEFPADAYSCDQFRMYEFKVRKCARGRSHDWTECPFAHPGEKARRRDPRACHYSGTACPDFRKGNCRKGDACEFAHGVFECWLHPARYRTQPCKDGLNCKRRVCFFAHSPEQLRVLSPRYESYDGSPHRFGFDAAKTIHFVSSPESGSPPSESPPLSPMTAANSVNSLSRSLGSNYVSDMVASLRQLQLNKVKSMPSSWTVQIGSPVHGSPVLPVTRPGFRSLPSTPTQCIPRSHFDLWEESLREEEDEIPMERVESGRGLRARMFQKLSEENPLDGYPNPSDAPNPDVGWVSDLIN
nr:zinc finger CCCH domain-containing protein 20-like [Ipomoea batatas]